MDEFPQATQGSQVSVLEETEDATDPTMPQVIPRQVNGTAPTNGHTAIPRQGHAVYAPIIILNVPAIAIQDIDLSNDPAAYVAQTSRVNGSDMQQSEIMRTALLADSRPLQPPEALPRPRHELGGPSPTVLSRQGWVDRQLSRAALLRNWSHISSLNGGTSQQLDRTTLSTWHDALPNDEPYNNIEEIDHLGLPTENNDSLVDENSGSDNGAVAGSSPRSPRQAD